MERSQTEVREDTQGTSMIGKCQGVDAATPRPVLDGGLGVIGRSVARQESRDSFLFLHRKVGTESGDRSIFQCKDEPETGQGGKGQAAG